MEPIRSCEAIWDLLSVYADDLANPDEAYQVERHIAVCADCARDLQFMRDTAALLSRTPDVAPPPGLRDAILAATIYRPTPLQRAQAALRSMLPRVSVRSLSLASAAAAALAIVVINARQTSMIPPVTGPNLPAAQHIDNAFKEMARTNIPATDPGKPSESPTKITPPSTTEPSDVATSSTPVTGERRAYTPVTFEKPVTKPKAASAVPKLTPRHAPPALAFGGPRIHPKPLDDRMPMEPGGPKETQPDKPMSPDEIKVAGMPPAGNAPMGTNEKEAVTEPTRAASASTGTSRLMIALNTTPSSGASDAYSLASLRASLRKQNDTPKAINVDLGMNDRRQMLDVYRSRF